MRELALFAGAGGGILGGKLIGWETCCAVEIDAFREGILLTRQNEGFLPIFPIWDDVSTFDGYPLRGIAKVVSGGFPCPDIAAGGPGTGIHGSRSGLVFEMLRIIDEVRPAIALFENSPHLTIRGLEHILFHLAKMGYNAKWGVLGANQAGASHGRKRLWIVASDPDQNGQEGGDNHDHDECGEKTFGVSSLLAPSPFPKSIDDIPAPHVFGTGDGLANWLDAVSACGDGQVPAVVKLAWETLRP